MKDVKYYILAYSMLIYLFLKKYVTLLYLLVKAQFTDKTRNLDIFHDINEDMHCRIERRHFMPNSTVCEIYPLDDYKTLFKIVICTTHEYILIQLEKFCDVGTRKNGYNNSLKRIIFAKRDLLGEKEGSNINNMVTQNVNYYFKKKNSIVYEKNFNGSKTHRFLYRIE